MKKAFLYCISGVLVISITGNVIQYVASQNRVEELNTALATSQSQLEAVTNELAELKPKLVQLEHDFSLLYTDYSKLELELSNPEQPEVSDQQTQQGQQGTQNQQGQQGTQGQTETSKPTPPVNHDTPSQGNKPQPSTEQQQTQTQPSTPPQQGPSEESIREAMEGGGEGGYVDFEAGLVDEFIPIE